MVNFHFRDLTFILAVQASTYLQVVYAKEAGEDWQERRERLRPHMILPPTTDAEGKYSEAVQSMKCVGGKEDVYVKAAILGGGMAGVAACAILQDKVGVKDMDYVLIEAQNRLGGRMLRSKTANSDVIEFGANWIVGGVGSCDVNPVWKLAVDHGLQVFKQDFYSWYTFNNSTEGKQGEVDKETVRGVMKKFRKALRCVDRRAARYWESMGKNNYDKDRDQGIQKELRDCGWEAKTPLEMQVENFRIDYDYARMPVGTSLASFPQSTKYGPDSYLVTDPRGYEYIAERHAQEKCDRDKIVLGREVYRVTFNEGGEAPVTVRTVDTARSGHCIDYHVHKVIPTFSVGVLESNPTLFGGGFKITENNVFEMTQYQKVFFRFPEKFWSDDTEFINVLTDKARDCSMWQSLDRDPTIARRVQIIDNAQDVGKRDCESDDNNYSEDKANLTDFIMPGSNIIFCTLTTDAIEKYYNGKVTQDDALGFLEQLRAVFGDIPDPSEVIIPDWIGNPWARGSYENWLVGKTYQDFLKFIRPRRDKNGAKAVFPSGSHTCLNHWGNVHGAFLAGERAANMVLRRSGITKGVPTTNVCDE